MRRAWAALAAALLAALCALPAQAQRNIGVAGSPAEPRTLLLQPPSDGVMPPNDDPSIAADPDQGRRKGCVPAWPCRLQLFGVIEKNGGVGLKGTALNW